MSVPIIGRICCFSTVVGVSDEGYSLDKSLGGFRTEGDILDEAESPCLLEGLVLNKPYLNKTYDLLKPFRQRRILRHDSLKRNGWIIRIRRIVEFVVPAN